jgi:hypothetical protein
VNSFSITKFTDFSTAREHLATTLSSQSTNSWHPLSQIVVAIIWQNFHGKFQPDFSHPII